PLTPRISPLSLHDALPIFAHVLRNFLGKATGPTFGRDGNMHFGVPERGVFPLVSMLGDLCPVVVGAALAFKRRREPRVALTFFGDRKSTRLNSSHVSISYA